MRRGRSQAAPPPVFCAVSRCVASRLAVLLRGVFSVWSGADAVLQSGRILPPDETQATPARVIPSPGETQATPARPQQYDSSQFRHAGAAAVTPARTTGHAGAVLVSLARTTVHAGAVLVSLARTTGHAGAVLVSPARTTRHAGAVPVSHVSARPFVWVCTRELAVVTTPRGQLPLGVTRPWYHSRAAHLLPAAATNWLSSSTRPGAPSPWPRPPREAGRPASDRLTTGREPVRRGVHE